jgi:hypothetical protein
MASLSLDYIGIIVPLSTLIPVSIGVCYWRVSDRALHLITIYLVMSFTINSMSSVLSHTNRNALPLLHLDTLFESLLMFSFFGCVLLSRKAMRFCRLLCFVFPVICILELVFVHGIYQFNSYSRPLESLIIVLLSIFYLSEQLGNERRNPKEAAAFLIVIGAMLYFSASFFQFLFSNLVSTHVERSIRLIIWNIHATFVLFMYLLMAAGLSKLKYA